MIYISPKAENRMRDKTVLSVRCPSINIMSVAASPIEATSYRRIRLDKNRLKTYYRNVSLKRGVRNVSIGKRLL